MHLCWRAWATTRHVEVGENLWESVLAFYHLGFWFIGKSLYPLYLVSSVVINKVHQLLQRMNY